MLRSLVGLCVLGAAAATADLSHTSAFTNTRVQRKINLAKHVVTSNTSYTVTGKGGSKYFLAFTTEEASHLAAVRVELDGAELPTTLDTSIDVPGFVHYLVKLGKAVTSEPISFTVHTVSTGVLVPKPAAAEQKDPHLVLFNFNAYVTSPYPSEKQSTTLALGTTRVESYSSAPAPVGVDGARLKFGPYGTTPVYASEGAYVHFETGAAFATLRHVLREVEVSHWGNVAVEEHYTLAHDGVALARGFSRIDYQTRGAKSGSFSGLTAHMPAGASDVYYRDVIGNISSSHVRSGKDATIMDIDFRFPLFGGWKTEWYQGYNVPAHKYLAQEADGSFTLTFDAHIPYSDIPMQSYDLKVVLPEGAVISSVTAPFPHKLSQSRRFTYLDGPFAGRAISVISTTGVIVSGTTYPGVITVKYTVAAGYSVWAKAGYLIAAFAALFVLTSLASRLDISIGPIRSAVAVGKKQD